MLATGSVKRPIPGAEFGGRVIGTEEAWALEALPATMAVVGAGASGAEIASAYARLGSEVSLFEALDRVLPTEDADISKLAERGLKRQGIKIHTGTLVKGHRVRRERGQVHLRRGVKARPSGWSSPPGAVPTSRGWGWRRPGSSWARAA